MRSAEAGRRSRKIIIERPHKKCRVTIHSARPGVVIGKKGADIDKLRKHGRQADRSRKSRSTSSRCASPRSTRPLVAEIIAQQLERRVAFRRAMKRAVQSAMRLGAEGIRINCSGRLGGAEIARLEWYREGRVPLHTLRADIDYGFADRPHRLRHLRHQGVDLQGRDPRARSDGAGQARSPRPIIPVGDRPRREPRERDRDPGRDAALSSLEGLTTMLQPKKTKFRKAFKGRIHGVAKGGVRAEFRRSSA